MLHRLVLHSINLDVKMVMNGKAAVEGTSTIVKLTEGVRDQSA
jgi:hypothetical protein